MRELNKDRLIQNLAMSVHKISLNASSHHDPLASGNARVITCGFFYKCLPKIFRKLLYTCWCWELMKSPGSHGG